MGTSRWHEEEGSSWCVDLNWPSSSYCLKYLIVGIENFYNPGVVSNYIIQVVPI
jgi:hypothetical protein